MEKERPAGLGKESPGRKVDSPRCLGAAAEEKSHQMMEPSNEHELEAVRQLTALSKEKVGPTPRERIAIAQVYATMAMASALSAVADALVRVGRKI